MPPRLTLKSPVAQVTCSVNGLTANLQKAAEPGTLMQVMKGNYDCHVPLPSFVEDRRTWSPSESFCDLFVTSNHNTCKVTNIALGNKCCEKYIFKKYDISKRKKNYSVLQILATISFFKL